jgi:glycosyltransferase involved in cell wall biosynthesis
LFSALDLLNTKYNIQPLLLCTGKTNDYFPTIRKEMSRLGLNSQVKFVGFVSELEIQCLYRLCRCMVFPSKYEGWGLPVTEAMRIGVPVACSDLPVLREHAGNAPLYFNPENPQEISNAIFRIWTDPELRRDISKNGQKAVELFSWNKTAKIFRAYYRFLAAGTLGEEDAMLISI